MVTILIAALEVIWFCIAISLYGAALYGVWRILRGAL